MSMSPEGQFLWMFILAIAPIVAIAAALSSMRRKPPISEELYRDFVTKSELDALRQEVRKTWQELFGVTRALKDDIGDMAENVATIKGFLSRCPGASACAGNQPGKG